MIFKIIDCTFRDGGYYNNWDFSIELINEYLASMDAAKIDYVEIGFRSFDKHGFKGACAYSTDDFIRALSVPASLKIGVMVNAAELINHPQGVVEAAKLLFSLASNSPVSLVRIACHIHEFEKSLEACLWLKKAGYTVGINLMQIADRTEAEIQKIGALANESAVDVLYFADSLGGMDPVHTAQTIRVLRQFWKGELGIHAHDNMGNAIANNLRAIEEGVTWADSTVTGMGRGPGNSQTEYMILERDRLLGNKTNITPLLVLMRKHFLPMQHKYAWGKNPYYYMAGQYGIHPSYIQEILNDPRYSEPEILFAIDSLQKTGGKKFSISAMEDAMGMHSNNASGSWAPRSEIQNREVLILGPGPSLKRNQEAIQAYIRKKEPFVIALNTLAVIDEDLINLRVACHPFRLLADCKNYLSLPQPLAIPVGNVQKDVLKVLSSVDLRDFGLSIASSMFKFGECSAITSSPLVIAYALALATSGNATRILLAGFDGYASDDPRTIEMNDLLEIYQATPGSKSLLAITPTKFKIYSSSVYAL